MDHTLIRDPHVAVYIEKLPVIYLRQLAGERIHKADAIAIVSIDRDLIEQLVARLDRRMTLSLSISDGHLFVSHDQGSIDGAVERLSIPTA